MPGLIFSIADTLRELESAKQLTRRFTENAESVFPKLKVQMESLEVERSQSATNWGIPLSQPLRTKLSRGEYEPGGGGVKVCGELSFTWKIQRMAPKKAKDRAKQFRLVGNASTVARVFEIKDDDSKGDEIAMWRCEIGDDQSPGCHFHVQVMGQEDEGPFPKKLSIPRLPSCLPSPMVALEFLIAELFQDSWKKHMFSESSDLQHWRSIQRDRFKRLYDWQTGVLSGQSQLSPWSALKYAKPPENIFVK